MDRGPPTSREPEPAHPDRPLHRGGNDEAFREEPTAILNHRGRTP
jgi:hypothetical protein